MIAFILRHHDMLILIAWTILFVGLGAVCMWLYLHHRWYEGISTQLAREATRKVFRERQ